MLISFAMENHRSVRRRLELSFVAETRPTVDERVSLHIPSFDLEVLPVVGLVGANGSGKSAVMDAVAYAASAVRLSQREWDPDEPPPRWPFKTRAGPDRSPSRFEITFVDQGVVYEYKFAVGEHAIPDESLSMAPNGPRSWTRLFDRTTTTSGKVEINFGRRLLGPRAAAHAATRPNSLFLSSAAQNNHQQLTLVWRWLVESLRPAGPHTGGSRGVDTARQFLARDDAYRDRIRRFVGSADLGIRDVVVRTEQMSESEVESLKRIFTAVDPEHELPIWQDDEFTTNRTELAHHGDVGPIALEDESAGTRAWFEWAGPVIAALDGGQVLAADEIDAHLNSLLASELIGLFQSGETNQRGGQLLFNVQDAAVLTQANLGRDQIWVIEKDDVGVSSATPISDYAGTRRWEPGRAFQHGRFGGLPIVDEEALAEAAVGTIDRD
jgi:hypothetical protein